MTDVVSPETRSRMMAGIRGRDTKPELIVRRALHAMGYRYRLHDRALPGRPDLVFPSRRSVLFVHGCFWHRHDCALGRPQPANNAAFWADKLQGNVRRDREARERLQAMGWRVGVVWECQIRQGTWSEAVIRFLDDRQDGEVSTSNGS